MQEGQAGARRSGDPANFSRPRWPMIVLRSAKGWTGPAELNGKKLEGFWRSHQVPLLDPKQDLAQLEQLESWLPSYRPGELFDAKGDLFAELRALSPIGQRRRLSRAR